MSVRAHCIHTSGVHGGLALRLDRAHSLSCNILGREAQTHYSPKRNRSEA